MAWYDANLPKPYWTAQTHKNGHAHICYKLEIPLCTSELASQKLLAMQLRFKQGLPINLVPMWDIAILLLKILFTLIGVQPFGQKGHIRSTI